MKKILLFVGMILIVFSCKKNDSNEDAFFGIFPKTIVEEVVTTIGTVITTDTYTLSGNKITVFSRLRVVEDGSTTVNEIYTISYDGDLINKITLKSNSQSNRNFTYTFAYNGRNLQSITRNDNAQRISYQYANGRVTTKTTVSGSETKIYDYIYEDNKVTMIARNIVSGSNDRFTYSFNADGTVASLEKITYVGNVPDASTKGSCTYAYDNKPNIYQRDLFKYLAEIELLDNYKYYGTHDRDPLIRNGVHNIISFTKSFRPSLRADYEDLENAIRTFSYEWNANNTPKSMEYKKNNAHKTTYTYTY